ncbi:MAG: hypothetical protein IKH46_05555 [Lachnospiraceae bacterium]|nr:hypothetical protein [Lachnospiraceae bacterium]
MSEFEKSYATGMMNEQQFNQLSQALYNYCKVMSVPKLGAAPVVITVLTGGIITLLLAALGESLLLAVAVGAIVIAVFAFLFWLAYRYRAGASKRLNSFLAEDGGRMMISDFAVAQPFVNDQFRLGRYYLYIRNGAVLKLDSIVDVVRIATRSGVGLNVTVNDTNGSMSFLICRLPMLNSWAAYDEIRNAVMQRR